MFVQMHIILYVAESKVCTYARYSVPSSNTSSTKPPVTGRAMRCDVVGSSVEHTKPRRTHQLEAPCRCCNLQSELCTCYLAYKWRPRYRSPQLQLASTTASSLHHGFRAPVRHVQYSVDGWTQPSCMSLVCDDMHFHLN